MKHFIIIASVVSLLMFTGCSSLDKVAEASGKVRKYAEQAEPYVVPALEGFIAASEKKLESGELDDKEKERLKEHIEKAKDVAEKFPEWVKKIQKLDNKIQALVDSEEAKKEEPVLLPAESAEPLPMEGNNP